MDLHKAIACLERYTSRSAEGLPKDLFLLVSRLAPLVNVDLIVKDEVGRVLLSWRDDEYAGTGWHVPGGIIRYQERFIDRVKKVAQAEIRAEVCFEEGPVAINQIIDEKLKARGHFVSLLYRGSVPGAYEPVNHGLLPREAGYLQWHAACPDDLIEYHEIYCPYTQGEK